MTTHITVGQRIRRFRDERSMSITQLAESAGVAKSYLSTLENDVRAQQRPSAKTLFAIATALGVTMADLLGHDLASPVETEIPAGLREFAAQAGIPDSDVQMLASIQFRGELPQTAERWQYIYNAIKHSSGMDTQ